MTNQEHAQKIQEKVEAAQARGVPVQIDREAAMDLVALHGPSALHELDVGVDREIAIFDAVRAGSSYEEAARANPIPRFHA